MNIRGIRLLACVRDHDQRALLDAFIRANGPDVMRFDEISSLGRRLPDLPADLLILQIDGQAIQVQDLVRQLRHSGQPATAFAVVVALIHAPDRAAVKAAVDGGVDDLLLMPCSAAHFQARIEAIARKRKPWVVTTDYVGPDRRKDDRSVGMQVPLLDVPNPLAGHAAAGFQRQAADALAMINEQKIERHAFQLSWLLDRLLGAESIELMERTQFLAKLVMVSNDLRIRVPTSSRAGSAAEADDLCAQAERLQAAARVDASDLQAMKDSVAAFRSGSEDASLAKAG